MLIAYQLSSCYPFSKGCCDSTCPVCFDPKTEFGSVEKAKAPVPVLTVQGASASSRTSSYTAYQKNEPAICD